MKTKIYISCHKDSFVPDNPLLFPVQAGSAIAETRFDGMLHDDEGDNISAKNRMYCELTTQYWAWKNDNESDYIGFCHYRRYFNFSGKSLNPDEVGFIVYNTPLNQNIADELGMEPGNMERTISQYDIIVPTPRIIKNEINIYENYVKSHDHHKKDIDTALEVLKEKYPEYAQSADKYMQSIYAYELNMFIMRYDLFKDYSEWLFNILFEAEKRIDFTGYSQYEMRVMGLLSERLFGIWFTHNREKLNLKTAELEKTFFTNTEKPVENITTQKNAVVTVLACNDDYVPYTAAMLKSIVQNARQQRPYEIYLLTTDISEKNQEKLQHLLSSDKRFSLACINVNNYCKNQDFFVHLHISVETYYRFFILDLFENTQKVLYLDCDMIVNADIAELYDTELGDNYLAAAKDADLSGALKLNSEQSEYVKNTVGTAGPDEYFQAGVLLFNLPAMKAKADAQKLIQISQERNWYYMDQDILNHVYQKKIVYLDQEWNCLMGWRKGNAGRIHVLKEAPYELYEEYLKARKSPKIVHYAGFQKPWNQANCDFSEYFWKYSRQTEFYEEVLARHNQTQSLALIKEQLEEYKKKITELENNLSSRKYLIKCLMGKGIFFKACRKFWRMLRKF